MTGKTVEKDAVTKAAQQRLSVLEMSETLGNIPEACRRGGMDRTSLYGWKRRLQSHGPEGLKDMPPIPRSQHNQATPENEEKVLECSLAHPSWSCVKLSNFLKLQGVAVSSPTVQKILIRHGLASVYDRWLKVEARHLGQHRAIAHAVFADLFALLCVALEEGIELTAEQLAKIEKYNRCFKERNVESSRPEEPLGQSIFMVGRPKGVGTVYHQAYVDTYSSYALGFLHTGKKPECAAALIHNDVLPFFKDTNLLTAPSLPTTDRSSAARKTILLSFILPSMTLNTVGPGRNHPRPMGSLSASTRLFSTSSSGSRSAKTSMRAWMPCKKTSINGVFTTTPGVPTGVNETMAKGLHYRS